MPHVYMRFTFDKRWTCDFVNQFTQQRVRTLRFTDAEKIRELAQRGKALTDLSSKNNFEHGIRNGGGGVILDGKMAFPNAVVRVSQNEADYWFDPANKAKAPGFLSSFFDSAIASVAPYQSAGRFKTFSGNQQLETGIWALATPGHTPGHTSYVIQSGAQTLLVWGDIIHVASIQLQNPTASVEYDTDAPSAQRSRRAMLQLAASKHLLVGAEHISFPGLGHIRANGNTYDWIPVNYDGDPGKH